MKGLKTGGRQKGTPNKATTVVSEILSNHNMNLVEEAMSLYHQASDPEFKMKVITLLFPYVYPKRVDRDEDSTLDITPEAEAEAAKEALEYIEQTYPQIVKKDE